MKKAMRKLMSLVLVILLVASIALPAMAVAEGTGTHGMYSYTYRVVCEETYGTAGITANKVPTYVSVYAYNQVYSEEYDTWGYAGSSEDGTEYTGYVSASVTVGNTFEIGTQTVTGIVQKTCGTFYVNGNLVLGSVIAD